MPTEAPFGSWRSPITAASIAAGETPLGGVTVVDGDVYWLEGRPTQAGRVVVMQWSADGAIRELTPPGWYVRTRVHEYGGGAYTLHGSTIFFSNFADQRLYRQEPGLEPQPITPEPDVPAGARYADARMPRDGRLLVCVRELHHADGREATNDLVVVPTDGSSPPRTIVSGYDFYAAPRINPDGKRLAWLCWNHPRMPWDGSELWVADLAVDGSVSNARCVAGGGEESIFQPDWSPDGVLHFVSDRTGWWNLYRFTGEAIEILVPMDAEFGVPQWQFGLSSYVFLDDGRIVSIYSKDGFDYLALIRPGHPEEIVTLDLPYTSIARTLRSRGNNVVCVASSPTQVAAIIQLDLASGEQQVLKRSVEHAPDPAYVSRPRPIAFGTDAARATAYALYYPPTNPDFVGSPGERPPLVVLSHGGPTSMARAELSLEKQFWTSRGFGVVDVNYGGSSGFGRAYRQRLNGRWGIVDTDDCINAARYLAEQGECDGQRLVIRGGSAGGYTTLCALVFHDDFSAGASYYGVADAEALATDTHKFESRYLDGLIGPYPAARDLYRERSPIHCIDRLSCPVILFQGLEDRVVPPSQAEAMARVLHAKGLPYAYLAFEGEQHGFRKAETIQRALEAELYFYSRVLRFPLSEPIEPIKIENLG